MTDDPMSDDPRTDDPNFLTRRLRWGVDPDADVEGHAEPEIATDAPADASIDFGDEDWDTPEPDPVPVMAFDTALSFERRDLARRDEEALDRRRQLWRDTAIILSGIVIALLIAQVLLPGAGGTAMASPTPVPTDGIVGPTASPDAGPSATSVPIVDPSLGIDATPTPIPVVTLPPTGSAAPTHPGTTPRATLKPVRTPTPTPAQTSAPTPTPTPTAEPTLIPPAPHAAFSWSQDGLTTSVLFSDASTGSIDTWSWDFGDGASSSEVSPSHDYGATGVWQVTLTVTGPGGSDSVTMTVSVV